MLFHPKVSPSTQAERLVVIDILRGIALFGILLVNMNAFHSPSVYATLLQFQLWDGRIDTVVNNAIEWAAQGKFYTLFSLLFGMSFILLAQRMQEKSVSVSRVMRRRLFFLLVIGLLHLFLLWWGDVLTWYALGGFVLLAFLPSKPKTWLIWAGALIAVYVLLIALAVGTLSEPMEAQSVEATLTVEHLHSMMKASYSGYTGHYGDVFRQRIDDISYLYSGLIMTTLFLLIPLFLLGMYIGKTKIDWFANRLSHDQRQRMKLWAVLLFIVGIVFTVIKQWSTGYLQPGAVSGYELLNFVMMVMGDTALCLFYVALLLCLYHWRPTWRIWSYLVSAGRMAMTNYLLQTIVCTTIFYGYGFALYGRIGPAQGTMIAILLYACQLAGSKWWLRRFRQGPFETVWRKYTYSPHATRNAQTNRGT